jgi:hypothetical protein
MIIAVAISAHIGRRSEPGAGDRMIFRGRLIRSDEAWHNRAHPRGTAGQHLSLTAPRTVATTAASTRAGGWPPCASLVAAWTSAGIIDRSHAAGTSAGNVLGPVAAWAGSWLRQAGRRAGDRASCRETRSTSIGFVLFTFGLLAEVREIGSISQPQRIPGMRLARDLRCGWPHPRASAGRFRGAEERAVQACGETTGGAAIHRRPSCFRDNASRPGLRLR